MDRETALREMREKIRQAVQDCHLRARIHREIADAREEARDHAEYSYLQRVGADEVCCLTEWQELDLEKIKRKASQRAKENVLERHGLEAFRHPGR